MRIIVKNSYNKHKETINNFFWRALQLAGKEGAGFLMFFIAASFLSYEDFGLLNYLIAIMGIFIIFCDFGISSAITKYTAEYNISDKKKSSKILYTSLTVSFLFSLLVSFFIIFFGRGIFENYNLILLFIPFLFFAPLSSVVDGVYRGNKDFKRLSIITLVVGILSLILSYFLIEKYSMIGFIISQDVLYFLLTFFLLLFRKESKLSFNRKIVKEIFSYSLVIGFTSIVYYMYNKADILILKHFDYTVEIGYYEVVNKIFKIMFIPFIIIGQVIAPNITKYYVKGDYRIIKRKLSRHIIFSILSGLFLAIILYFSFPFLIKIFFNKYFIPETILIFNILLLLLPLRILASVISQGHTLPTGNAKYSLWTMIPAGILNVILDFIFIMKYGFIGVVYSTAICYSFATISFVVLYYFKLRRLTR